MLAEQTHTTDETELQPADAPITVDEFAQFVREAINQQPWRANADKEADYADGNQLDSELLQRQKMLGIPPAKENIIGPAIRAVCGYEAKTRTDWRVTPDGDPQGQDVADALNYRLNQAERHSRADRALSDAFRSAATVGIGWVEVTRASNALQFPYKCRAVHRNEIWWDMQSVEPDLEDARWLFRRRWVDRQRAARMFPEHATIIMHSADKWIADLAGEMLEGGQSTGLAQAIDAERAWTVQEDNWYNDENQQVCLTELWYRRWAEVTILRAHTGRAVEYDPSNPAHDAMLHAGRGVLERQIIPKMRRAYFMGPHCLHDGPTPHPHQHFPYVPVWGNREDMTGIPYGLVRDMLFPQDNLNASISKLRWGMSATRIERTKGAVAMTDEVFRRMAARVDADITLDADHMARPGARFEVKRDFQLNAQQFDLMNDSRRAMERVSGITAAFQGQKGTAASGIQEQTQLEQSQVAVADLMDNFKEARRMVGELLMSLIITDMGKAEQTIVIEGDTLNPPRTVVLNHPEIDPDTGIQYLSNDVQRTRLMVALEDVPSSSSFRAQQLAALSESVKSLPQKLQTVVMPFMIDLMDLPRKDQIVQAIRQATAQADPEQLREQIKRELMFELKERELAIKESESEAKIKKLMAEAVQTGVQAAFSAMQAGAQVAHMPQIAPIADVVMQGAGYKRPNPMGDDPNFPQPTAPAVAEQAQAAPEVRQNTSPTFPPVPDEGASPMAGIETPETRDNLTEPS
ncbi:hypothetical protein [Thauera humireducens]|uniref:Portal protein n=1 Tax=Thauera humireducens TaxID=1134435 RepID=A0A127K383_9RHOO|nr:hypothetical protein [Thauera humireducens]AMO36422.1 hypothetical protein AC731_005415 [Thauera humireducens]